MIIRKAAKQDSHIISEHLFLAMEDILYKFIGIKNTLKTKEFLRHFVEKENNQYSFQNCFVAEGENEILLKVCQNEQTQSWTKQWEFNFRITDRTGSAIHSSGSIIK